VTVADADSDGGSVDEDGDALTLLVAAEVADPLPLPELVAAEVADALLLPEEVNVAVSASRYRAR
jgi:hypothetical protein